ncbi:MAG: stalk domain-containing protein [Thermacetogeniaceae bacterium]
MYRLSKSKVVIAVAVLLGVLACALAVTIVPAQAQASGPQVLVDNNDLGYPQPVSMNGRVLAPAFNLAGALGAKLEWDSVHCMATIATNDITIKLIVGNRTALLNDEQVELDLPAIILQDRLFAPVRFVAEALGGHASWDEQTQTVEIASKQTANVHRLCDGSLPANIAFTSNGYLWLLHTEEHGEPPVQVTHTGTVSIVGWSPDGQWLAYLQNDSRGQDAAYSDDNHLWVVMADGSGAYQVNQNFVPALSNQMTVAWSPTDNTIVYLTAPSGTQFTGYSIKMAQIAAGEAKTSTLVPEIGDALDFGWAPDGRSLAVSFPANSEQGLRIDRIVLDGKRLNLLQFGNKVVQQGDIISSWGATGFKWSPDGEYLAYYLRPNSGSLSADGVAIELLDSTTGKTLDLGCGLSYPEWLAWSPDSKRLAFIKGSGREATMDKRLFIANMADGKIDDCGSVGQVDAQPVWTQTVPYRVVFCRGAESLNWEGQPKGYWGVMAPGQRIWLGDSSGLQALTTDTAGTSDYAPVISPDGVSLVFLHLDRMSAGSLFLAPLKGGTETELLSGLSGSPGYYGNYYPAWFSIHWLGQGPGEPSAQTLLAYQDVKFVLPDNWQATKGSAPGQEITFVDQNGLSMGGSFLEGYNPDTYLGSTIPNHSQEQSVENIDTPLGAGQLVVLKRGYDAASGRTDNYQEVWAVIPITKLDMGYNMAYIFWVGVNGSVDQSKSILLQILNHTKN